MANKKIIIIGGGVIGLSIGWQLAKAGAAVTIYERAQAGRAASWAAAGMLAPLAEAHSEEPELLKLGSQSLACYAQWVDELEADAKMPIGYRVEGTLIVGLESDDTHQLRHLYTSQQELGLDVEWLNGRAAREIESALSPRVTAAIRCATDHQVDNRLMVQALQRAYQTHDGVLYENSTIERIVIENGAATGVQTQNGFHEAEVLILAAGCWSAQIEGLPDRVIPPVRPVKGQMLALQMEEGITVKNVIRIVRARYPTSVYLVPRSDGRLIVGATSEEMGFDTRLTAGGVFELLRGAWEAVPGIYELPLLETWSGLRPGSRDNAPILGKTPIENLIYATGHYRNGILLTPITAYEIAKLILTGETSETIAPFQLNRFLK
ncbi:glycine oxidase ThiO [Candidatus Poribacteria bacterium]|nr:glycine oxidase ThiO [Candidatus Poribacteria bacterium]MXY29392.1 glycine oxidase ThiO [Candidatus Poribacteria bacterium]MYK19991.1 glycine oxidase ThiO [Candidatus Poribacteria bacterium]